MKPEFDSLLHLLHGAVSGTLATHSLQLPGYPFASALPYALDDAHRPVFLLSELAEHTKNLRADPRASFLVIGGGESLLAGPRITLLGDVKPAEATPELQARYLRYQPDAEQYLALDDFGFFVLQPRLARAISGFAQMGWVEESEWQDAAVLALADEAALIQDLLGDLPPRVRLLGLDFHGIDIERQGKRERQRFPSMLETAEQIGTSARRLLGAL